jgi:hypothetical protein
MGTLMLCFGLAAPPRMPERLLIAGLAVCALDLVLSVPGTCRPKFQPEAVCSGLKVAQSEAQPMIQTAIPTDEFTRMVEGDPELVAVEGLLPLVTGCLLRGDSASLPSF